MAKKKKSRKRFVSGGFKARKLVNKMLAGKISLQEYVKKRDALVKKHRELSRE
jgi:hypothetical protein